MFFSSSSSSVSSVSSVSSYKIMSNNNLLFSLLNWLRHRTPSQLMTAGCLTIFLSRSIMDAFFVIPPITLLDSDIWECIFSMRIEDKKLNRPYQNWCRQACDSFYVLNVLTRLVNTMNTTNLLKTLFVHTTSPAQPSSNPPFKCRTWDA